MRVIVLLSPAKSLNWDAPPDSLSALWSEPPLLSEADPIIEVMRSKSKSDLKALMSVSDNIAELNHERYQGYLFAGEARRRMEAACGENGETGEVFRPAALAYDGPAYRGMQAASFSKQDWSFGKGTIRLLSGLYGILRPTDLIQPYRLEMDSRVGALGSKDLYSYWKEKVTERLIEDAQEATPPGTSRSRRGSGHDPDSAFLVVNVASQEYAKVVDFDAVRKAGGRVITCVFKDDGRVLAVFAKRARGLLARHVVLTRAKGPSDIRTFAADGYHLDNAQSEDDLLVFTRTKGERPALPLAGTAQSARGKRSAPAASPEPEPEPEPENPPKSGRRGKKGAGKVQTKVEIKADTKAKAKVEGKVEGKAETKLGTSVASGTRRSARATRRRG